MKYLIVILLLAVTVKSKTHYDSLNNFIIEKYFYRTDSITLRIPAKYTPKFVYDFAVSKNFIYMLSESNYPILQFKKNGEFVRWIGEKGNGPEEFQITPLKIAANSLSDNFVAVDGPIGISLYQYIPGKKIKKYTDTSFFEFVDIDLINEQPVIVCSSSSKKHIKILDKKFKIKESFIDIPEESKILSSVGTSFWGIQRTGTNAFLSHVGYPFRIYKNHFDINTQKFESSQLPITHNILSDFNAPHYKEEYSVSTYKKYSKIRWVIASNKYLVGTFFGYDENGKPINETFLIKDNKLIQKWHLNIDDILSIIPVGNQLIVHKYGSTGICVNRGA